MICPRCGGSTVLPTYDDEERKDLLQCIACGHYMDLAYEPHYLAQPKVTPTDARTQKRVSRYSSLSTYRREYHPASQAQKPGFDLHSNRGS